MQVLCWASRVKLLRATFFQIESQSQPLLARDNGCDILNGSSKSCQQSPCGSALAARETIFQQFCGLIKEKIRTMAADTFTGGWGSKCCGSVCTSCEKYTSFLWGTISKAQQKRQGIFDRELDYCFQQDRAQHRKWDGGCWYGVVEFACNGRLIYTTWRRWQWQCRTRVFCKLSCGWLWRPCMRAIDEWLYNSATV